MGLRARIQELHDEVNCMNDSSDFLRMPSQYAVDTPTFPVNQRYFHLNVIQGDFLSRNNQPPDVWNSQGISGNVFANPPASSSSPYPGGFNPWISNVTEDTLVLTRRGQPVTCGERQNTRHSLGSEISARTVSRKYIRP